MAVPPRRPPHALTPARLLVLWLCLWGGLLQSTVGQTHLHAAAGARASAATSVDMAPSAPADAACLLCDIAGHSPVLAAPAPPLALAHAALLTDRRFVVSRSRLPSIPAHHWRGRGPPILA